VFSIATNFTVANEHDDDADDDAKTFDCTKGPCGSYGEFRDSCGIFEQTSKRSSISGLVGNLTFEPAHSVPAVRRSVHEPKSSTDMDGATMEHDYHGQTVRSVYYKIQSYPTPPICFRIAGEYTLEVPHPKFPELFVPPIIAGFMCSTLVDNIHSPQNSDWSQIYVYFDAQTIGKRPSSIKTLWRSLTFKLGLDRSGSRS
jgi:hypothetical protein